MLQRPLRNLKGLLVFSGLTLNTVVLCMPLFLLALVKLLLPVAVLRRVLTRWLMRIGELWIGINAAVFALVNDTRWELRGLEGLSPDEWYLVVVNHQSWVDIVVLQSAFNRRMPLLKFFVKQQLIWFPFLGLAFWALDMPFMKRYSKTHLARHPQHKDADFAATRAACEKFRLTPTSVINFVEGTRFSKEKRERRNSPYRNLLPPRAGGIALALSSLGDRLSAIVDVTIVYPAGVPKFWDLVCGELDAVIVDVRQRSAEEWMLRGEYTTDRDHRQRIHQWLGEIWKEKDARIEALRAAG